MHLNNGIYLAVTHSSRRSCCILQAFTKQLLQIKFSRVLAAKNFSYFTKDDMLEDYSSNNKYSRGWSKHNSRRDVYENKFPLKRPDWEKRSLQPIEKNFYVPSERVLNRTEEEIMAFRNLHNMTLRGDNIPAPIQQFEDYNFTTEFQDYFHQKEFKTPTPIQAQGWPIALSGRDFIGIGQTGSGKTLGFIFPALVHISHQSAVQHGEGPIVLVMAPTRELAQQTEMVANELKRNITACVYGGGSNRNQQRYRLLKAPSIVVATPGRLLDFLECGVTNLERCSYLVLDEADRMLDMGFEPQIRKIIEQTRPDRQTLMWSATWPKEVRSLAEDFLSDYVQLNSGSIHLKANPNIKQEFIFCSRREKLDKFIERMGEVAEEESRILIFCETKKNVDFLQHILHKNRIPAEGIHGDHSQSSRNYALKGFRKGEFKVLVATNVAARGLDVDNISLVVNYDFPNCIEDYVHRIGRTARGTNQGTSLSYITEESSDMAKDLIKILKESNQIIPEELNSLVSYQPRQNFSRNRPAYSKQYGSQRNNDRRSHYSNY